MKKKRAIPILLIAILVFAMLSGSVLAANYSDTQGHWAAEQIAKWSDAGILQGADGMFRPNDPITRGEMAVILDRLMDYQTAASNNFSDLGQAFYTDAILKANAAGVIKGDGATVRPKDNITREEAVVMLGRALGVVEGLSTKEIKYLSLIHILVRSRDGLYSLHNEL